MPKTLLVTIAALLLISIPSFSQKFKIAFYNVENLCDTIDDPFIDDSDFTPKGTNHWTSQKYQTKTQNIARVIDHMNADIIGIGEVENEGVVRNLLSTMKGDYNYIHRNTRDGRGIDLALLYRGDTFFPKKVEQVGGYGMTRELLVIYGTLIDKPIVLIVCHMPSMMNATSYRSSAAKVLRTFIDKLLLINPKERIIVMGDFNAAPTDNIPRTVIGIGTTPKPLFTPFTELSRKGYGTYIYRDKRQVIDYIALSESLLSDTTLTYSGDYGIFVKDYMIQASGSRKGYPLRNLNTGGYTPGFSDHLPVMISLERK